MANCRKGSVGAIQETSYLPIHCCFICFGCLCHKCTILPPDRNCFFNIGIPLSLIDIAVRFLELDASGDLESFTFGTSGVPSSVSFCADWHWLKWCFIWATIPWSSFPHILHFALQPLLPTTTILSKFNQIASCFHILLLKLIIVMQLSLVQLLKKYNLHA